MFGGKALWSKYENGENMLFREADFRQPHQSALLRDLWNLGSEPRQLCGYLLLASAGPLAMVPLLDEVLDENRVRPLTRSEEEQARDMLRLPGSGRSSSQPLNTLAGGLPPLPSPLIHEPIDLEPTVLRRTDPMAVAVGRPAELVDWTPVARSSPYPVAQPVYPMAVPIPEVPQLVPVQLPPLEPVGRRIVVPLTPVPDVDAMLPPLPRRPEPAAAAKPASNAEILLIEVPSERPALPPVPQRTEASVDDPLATTWTWLRSSPLLLAVLSAGFVLLALLILITLLIALVKGH
jgi:hypothetical protein